MPILSAITILGTIAVIGGWLGLSIILLSIWQTFFTNDDDLEP